MKPSAGKRNASSSDEEEEPQDSIEEKEEDPSVTLAIDLVFAQDPFSTPGARVGHAFGDDASPDWSSFDALETAFGGDPDAALTYEGGYNVHSKSAENDSQADADLLLALDGIFASAGKNEEVLTDDEDSSIDNAENEAADLAVGQLADSLAGLSQIVEAATATIVEKALQRKRLRQQKEREKQLDNGSGSIDLEKLRSLVRLSAATGDVDALRSLQTADVGNRVTGLWLVGEEAGEDEVVVGEDLGSEAFVGGSNMSQPTALHVAAAFGCVDAVAFLLDAGMDATFPIAMFETTPLHCAASSGSLEVVELLLKRRAQVNIPAVKLLQEESVVAGEPAFATQPLHCAAESGNAACVAALAAAGANMLALDVYGRMPWMVAASQNVLDALVEPSAKLCGQAPEILKIFWCCRVLWDPVQDYICGHADEEAFVRLDLADRLLTKMSDPIYKNTALAFPKEWLQNMYGSPDEVYSGPLTVLSAAVNALDYDWVALALVHAPSLLESSLQNVAREALDALLKAADDTASSTASAAARRHWRAVHVMLSRESHVRRE